MNGRISLHDLLVVRGGRTVLDVPHLEVTPGEVLAVLGPNGAGKSTLVEALALLQRPARGQVRFDGEPVTGRELAVRRRMAVVFQEPLLLDMRVRENVALGLRLRGVPRRQRERRAALWMERLGIAALAGRRAHTLSGGEAQRTSLARALALEPEVLLLDEPFTGLDAPTRGRLIADLAALLRATMLTTVFVTHDRDEALHLADRVAVLVGGRLRQSGRVDEVFSRPADAEVAAFVGMETVVPGRVEAVEDGLVRVRTGTTIVEAATPRVAVGDSVMVCIRPEDVVIAPGPEAPPSSARNRLTGRVTAVVPAGGQRRVELVCGFPLVAAVTRRSVEDMAIAPGALVNVSFKASAVHLIAARASEPAADAAVTVATPGSRS